MARGRGSQMKGDREAGEGLENSTGSRSQRLNGKWAGPPGAGLAQNGVSRRARRDPGQQWRTVESG